MTERAAGTLRIGEQIDGEGKRNGTPVDVNAKDLVTHGVIVGMTGSGKTGLAISLIEETLLSGVPVLLIDPKGDLGNLCLAFPRLAADDFAPWVAKGDDPAAVATTWKEGLASWGLDGTTIQRLRDAAPVTIYTPGSRAGVPLNVIGSLAPPASADEESQADEIESFVSGLLKLVGIDADPLASREHILLSNLITAAWAAGRTVDLPGLIAQIQQPPMRKLGVIELDTFFPPKDRAEFALRVNGLLASPSFAAWLEGEALDVQRLLFGTDGKPRAAIISIAHCSDDERMFLVTLVLSKVVAWMRAQQGTTDLRALVYMDEVYGYVPPTAVPPSKKPILTLLKQARAFGVGLVVATQNPVDVDYKALSNAGTWLIGRLQTEQDKARLMDGLTAVSGDVDVDELGATIAHLEKRQFVWHQAGKHTPTTLTSRWALSYLAGPLTKEQISRLMEGQRPAAAAPAQAAPAPAPASPAAAAAAPADVAAAAPTAPAAPPVAAEMASDETPVAPSVPGTVAVRYLDPAAPWAATIGAQPTGARYEAAVAARVQLRYDDDAADLVSNEEYEAIISPLSGTVDASTVHQVDFDDRDLRPEAPAGIRYALPAIKLDSASLWKNLETDVRTFLANNRSLEVFRNKALKLTSRPGETREDFLARCHVASDEAQNQAAEKLRDATQKKLDSLHMTVTKAESRVQQLQTDTTTRRGTELLQGATSVLGALLGGSKSASSIARSIGSAASRRSQSARTAQRLDTAKHELSERHQQLQDIEDDLATKITALNSEWDAKAEAIDTVAVNLERTDINVTLLTLVWYPTA